MRSLRTTLAVLVVLFAASCCAQEEEGYGTLTPEPLIGNIVMTPEAEYYAKNERYVRLRAALFDLADSMALVLNRGQRSHTLRYSLNSVDTITSESGFGDITRYEVSALFGTDYLPRRDSGGEGAELQVRIRYSDSSWVRIGKVVYVMPTDSHDAEPTVAPFIVWRVARADGFVRELLPVIGLPGKDGRECYIQAMGYDRQARASIEAIGAADTEILELMAQLRSRFMARV